MRTKLLILFLFFTIVAFGQDTTIVFPDPGQPSIDKGNSLVENLIAFVTWVVGNWDSILGNFTALLAALIVVLRMVPTSKNWDLLYKAIEWLDSLKWLKNKRLGGGEFKVTSTVDEKK